MAAMILIAWLFCVEWILFLLIRPRSLFYVLSSTDTMMAIVLQLSLEKFQLKIFHCLKILSKIVFKPQILFAHEIIVQA